VFVEESEQADDDVKGTRKISDLPPRRCLSLTFAWRPIDPETSSVPSSPITFCPLPSSAIAPARGAKHHRVLLLSLHLCRFV
jgi:hypothetical protein